MFSNEELLFLDAILEKNTLTTKEEKLHEKIKLFIEFNKLNDEFNEKKSKLSEELSKLISK